MVFSSTVFLLAFLPLTLTAYFVIPQKYTAGRNIVLLTASLIFTHGGEPKYILLMLCSILCAGTLALEIQRRQMKKPSARRPRRADGFCPVASCGAGIFKYTDFLFAADSKQSVSLRIPAPGIALPIGISFYTFQTLSYIIDVYRKEIPAQKKSDCFRYVCISVSAAYRRSYCPISGCKRQTLRKAAEQCADCGRHPPFYRRFCKKNSSGKIRSASSGKKSHRREPFPPRRLARRTPSPFKFTFDFSGYSDMAIGLGKIFGFDYPENFRYPYISQSITEFWRRWHISLGTWFREYVYIPLGGNRKGTARQILNIATVWALTGLWHGASWNFVFWGIYFAVLLIAEKLFMLRGFLKNCLPPCAISMRCFSLSAAGLSSHCLLFSSVLQYFSMMAGKSGMLTDDIFFYFIRSRAVLLLICALFATPLPKKPQHVQKKLRKQTDALRSLRKRHFTACLLLFRRISCQQRLQPVSVFQVLKGEKRRNCL